MVRILPYSGIAAHSARGTSCPWRLSLMVAAVPLPKENVVEGERGPSDYKPDERIASTHALSKYRRNRYVLSSPPPPPGALQSQKFCFSPSRNYRIDRRVSFGLFEARVRGNFARSTHPKTHSPHMRSAISRTFRRILSNKQRYLSTGGSLFAGPQRGKARQDCVRQGSVGRRAWG